MAEISFGGDMFDDPLESHRMNVAERGSFGLGILADDLEDRHANDNLVELLRAYSLLLRLEDQTSVRMSKLPAYLSEHAKLLAEVNRLNALVNIKPKENQNIRSKCYFAKPIGPYFTHLTADCRYLAENMELLSTNPIRELVLSSIRYPTGVTEILRSYRLCFLKKLTINTPVILGDLRGVQGQCLDVIKLNGHSNQQVAVRDFLLADKIRTGCELWIGNRLITTR